MKHLTENDISLLRQNIPFVSRNIHEGWFADTLSKAKDVALKGLARAGVESLKSVQRGLDADTSETIRSQRAYELRRAADLLGMDQQELAKWRERAKDFTHPKTGALVPPRRPKPNAPYAEKARHEADLKDFARVEDVLRRTALLHDRSPEYRQAVETEDMISSELPKTLAHTSPMGKLLKMSKSGSKILQDYIDNNP